jgi:hypothetical protein
MEEFGFFNTVEEHLPPEFTMIYEIARIIEEEDNPISRALAPIMLLKDHSSKDLDTESLLIPNVPDAEEYEADLIRSVTEIKDVYPYQHLLPEEIFLKRLAERSLWMPRPRRPNNYQYQKESDRFAPDDRKQKVYILFDTSSSMRQHYRIHLARSIAYLFLRQNQRELGTIFFRTFDLTIGDLITARDIPSFDQLISTMMHVRAVGNGTSLQKALETAIDDISHESQLSQAQILVITDGVAHIDREGLREKMGEHIIVNTVKIGDAHMLIDSKIIEDIVYKSSSEDALRLRDLLRQLHDVEVSLQTTAGQMRKQALLSQQALVQKQIDSMKRRLEDQISSEYGLEIEQLSTVYVNIPDIPAEEIFSFPEQKISELEELAEALLRELREEHQVDDIKRAAVLYDHLYLLMQYNKIDAPRLERAAKELEDMLNHVLNEPSTQSHDLSISDMERSQLRHMLEGGFRSKVSLAQLLRVLMMKLRKWWRTRRQNRIYRLLTGKVVGKR